MTQIIHTSTALIFSIGNFGKKSVWCFAFKTPNDTVTMTWSALKICPLDVLITADDSPE